LRRSRNATSAARQRDWIICVPIQSRRSTTSFIGAPAAPRSRFCSGHVRRAEAALKKKSFARQCEFGEEPMHGSFVCQGARAFARTVRSYTNNPGRTRVMGMFTTSIKTMDDLFLHTLQDIYYAENQIVKNLPSMIEKATNRELTGGLKSHLDETKKQIERLEQVFEKIGEKPKAADCPAMDGLLEEAEEIAGDVADKQVLDAAIIGAAQAVEHYEISRYGTLIAWAEELGHEDVVRLLNTNLNEEKAADKKLSTIAERKGVNRKAAS
jgi:ferritin-like metal-binding protein YciE